MHADALISVVPTETLRILSVGCTREAMGCMEDIYDDGASPEFAGNVVVEFVGDVSE
jgi:hypothetical protein